jgi:hypothetical protein
VPLQSSARAAWSGGQAVGLADSGRRAGADCVDGAGCL